MLLAALSHPQPAAGVPDLTLTATEAAALIDLLPNPLPYGDPGNEYVLAHLLLDHEALRRRRALRRRIIRSHPEYAERSDRCAGGSCSR